ncbi:MAG: class I SAM-dependent methyltransferase [Thermoplasmata archaeon]|nr:class I SAM-dependent methyltransferase [Thermoplasmata archaeon]
MSPVTDRAYGRFAEYYDLLYHGFVDYEGDVAFLERVFRRYRRGRPRSLLDLGCGTGNHALPLLRRGYGVTGLDASGPMLAIARRKARAEHLPLRLVRGNMRSFHFGRSFDAAVSMFGAFGYLLAKQDVQGCLRSVRRHLVPDGLFAFEYWQTSGVRPGIQSWMRRERADQEILRLSESRFDPRTSRLTMDFHFLVFRGRTIRDRFDEQHVVRTYTRHDMNRLLEQAGFDRLAEFAVTPKRKDFRRVTRETFRILAVARPRAQH